MAELVVQIKADLTNYTNGMKQAGVVTSTAATSMTGKLNDVTKAQTALNASQKAAEQAFEASQKSIAGLTEKLARYKDLSANATDPTKLATYNRTIQATEKEIAQLGNVGKEGFDKIGNAVAKNTNSLTQGFSVVRQLAYVLPGVGIAGILAFATEPIIEYISHLDLFKAKITEITEKHKDLNKALEGTEYRKAISSVFELTENIKLAKEGFISKKEVLKEYNDTLGKTLGHADNLNKAEKLLIEKGPAYIKMTQLKAAAQIALVESATALAKSKSILDEQSDPFNQGNFSSYQAFRDDLAKRYKAQTTIAERQKNIFKSLQDEAAKVSKDNKLDIFGGHETGKVIGAFDLLKKKVEDLKKALENDVVSGAKPSVIKQAAIDLAIATDKLAEFERKIKEAQILPIIGTPISSPTGTVKDSVNALQPPALASRALPNFSKAITDLRDYTDGLTFAVAQEQILTDEQKKANAQYQTASRIANEMGGVFNRAFESMISGSQTAGQAVVQALESMIIKFIEAIAEAAILAGILSIISGGSVSFFGALLGNTGTLSKFTGLSVPAHADGGITTRAHLAMVGEGREPEAIMPLSKLQNFVDSNGSSHGRTIVGELSGSKLLLWELRANRQKGRIG